MCISSLFWYIQHSLSFYSKKEYINVVVVVVAAIIIVSCLNRSETSAETRENICYARKLFLLYTTLFLGSMDQLVILAERVKIEFFMLLEQKLTLLRKCQRARVCVCKKKKNPKNPTTENNKQYTRCECRQA